MKDNRVKKLNNYIPQLHVSKKRIRIEKITILKRAQQKLI